MKLRNIVLATSVVLGTATISFAATGDNMDTNVDFTPATATQTGASSSLLSPLTNTYGALTNENNTWGAQDRTGQWYLGVGANGLAQNVNSSSGAGGNFILGYNINKYFAVQYNQIVGKTLCWYR